MLTFSLNINVCIFLRFWFHLNPSIKLFTFLELNVLFRHKAKLLKCTLPEKAENQGKQGKFFLLENSKDHLSVLVSNESV